MTSSVDGTPPASTRKESGEFVDASNIETHFTVIAVINLLFSVPVILVGLLVFFGSLIGAGFAQGFSDVPGIGALIAGAGLIVGFFIAALGVPGTLSGIGLLQRRAWGKIWTLIQGALSLIFFPIGTAFGIYAIWVMTRAETDQALH